MTLCRLSLCCNGHRNGAFLGYAEALEVRGVHLNMPRIRIRDDGIGVLRFGQLRIPYRGYRRWWGNWCWDAWGVTPGVALAVLEYLRSRGGVSIEEAPTEFFEQWEQRHADGSWGKLAMPGPEWEAGA